MSFSPIGYLRSASGPRPEKDGWEEKRTDIILNDALAGDLHGIAAFSRVLVIYGGSSETELPIPAPREDGRRVGLLALHLSQEDEAAPEIATVRLVAARGNVVTVLGLDARDGTFVYDIKPCGPRSGEENPIDWTAGLLRDTH